MFSIKSGSKKTIALFSVLLCAVIFSIQDIWISKIVINMDPLLLTFWIFLSVFCFAVPVALIRGESFKIPLNSFVDLLGFNITTFFSWVFTFLALKEASPAVVGAGTLSAPLLIILVLFEKNKFHILESIGLVSIITIGLVIGSMENQTFHDLNYQSLIYCTIASLGVVGNSYYMKRLNKYQIPGNVVLSLRFILLLLGIGIYFFIKDSSMFNIDTSAFNIATIGLITSYIPLLILYFAHLHLSIFVINLLLALTPVGSILILGILNGFNNIDRFHLVSIFMILGGVYYGFLMEARREK